MADEATTAAPVDAPAVSGNAAPSEVGSSSLSLRQPAAAAEPIEAPHTNGATHEVPKEDEETAGKQATTEVNAPDGEGTAEVADVPSAPAVDGSATPASGKKDRRKSAAGVPEHKSKKLNKKKSMPSLHLECRPGDFYWARLKGYPPWPSIICDEQMLPESLLATRPVSTARPDGSIRDDFKEGGKNAKERTFPIMFLATNEFTWMINTSLTPLDPKECDPLPNTKMTKALQNAWKIASEDHDLQYFKGILKVWQEEQAQIEQEMRQLAEKEEEERQKRAAKAEEEATLEADEEKKPKKKARKSKAGDEDVEMEDAEAPKSTKKRKKELESDAEGKPKKTPKVTKINAPKTPNGEASAKKSSAKSKKKVVQAPKDDEEEEKPQMSEADKMAQREKAILYLRHRLQKGFLTRDQEPQEAEMTTMADFFSQLEGYENLEASIIRATKVHKVLKAIVKLSSIPKDEEYNFKKRSTAMLEAWNKRMEADGDAAPPSATAEKPPVSFEPKVPETNGEKVTEEPESAAPAVPAEAKDETETKEGAQKDAEEAAEKLDEKVGATEGGKEGVDEPPSAVAAEKTEPVSADVTMAEATDVETTKSIVEEAA